MDKVPVRVDGRFRLGDILGSSSYAVVYRTRNIIKNDAVAVKLEPITHSSSVQHEYNILKHLEGGVGIPRALWFGRESTYHALILDLLGPSLHSLFLSHNQKFSLETVINLGDQLVSHFHVSNMFTRTIIFTVTSNHRTLFWVLAIRGTPPSLLISVSQRNSGIC
ncbi:kinase-like domain-containing protein [Suillus variegatus]|nr:kinase-like domain-containing protein [Suillus variegatus]